MTGNVKPGTQLTTNDIEVGARIVEALVQHAKVAPGDVIAHDDLLTLARGLHPKDAVLGRAVPIGIGAKLQFVDGFCTVHAWPALACLAVQRASMRPAPPYGGDWDADRRAVAAFDWSDVAAQLPAQLPAYAAAVRATVPARLKPRKERPADVAWYAYFCSHRKECEGITLEGKKEIINLIMAGLDPETSLARVKAAAADTGAGTGA